MNENFYTPWHPEDDKALAQLFQSGKTISELAQHFRRSEGAIKARLKLIGQAPSSANPKPTNSRFNAFGLPKSFMQVQRSKDLCVDPKHGRIRKHYATGLEISEDGEYVAKSYSDPHTGDTKWFSPSILTDDQGREYITWSDKKVYIDDMVCTCFHGKRQPGQNVLHIDGKLSNCHASNLKWA